MGRRGFWIPAYAGMTVGGANGSRGVGEWQWWEGDGGNLHRHSGAGRNPEPRFTPNYTDFPVSIPPAGFTDGATGVLDSGLRRNDGGETPE